MHLAYREITSVWRMEDSCCWSWDRTVGKLAACFDKFCNCSFWSTQTVIIGINTLTPHAYNHTSPTVGPYNASEHVLITNIRHNQTTHFIFEFLECSHVLADGSRGQGGFDLLEAVFALYLLSLLDSTRQVHHCDLQATRANNWLMPIERKNIRMLELQMKTNTGPTHSATCLMTCSRMVSLAARMSLCWMW